MIPVWLALVPRWVWALLAAVALLGGVWLHGRHTANVKCQARWEAAQEATEAENARREAAAFKAGADAAQKAAQARQETREQTDEAVERVRVVWRDRVLQIPGDCRDAVQLPNSVRDEGRKAVAAARSALRSGKDG